MKETNIRMKGELAMRTGNYQGMSYEEDQTALNSTRILQLKEEGKYRKSYLLLGLCLCMGSRDALPLLGPLPLQGLQRWRDQGLVLYRRERGMVLCRNMGVRMGTLVLRSCMFLYKQRGCEQDHQVLVSINSKEY